VCLRVEIDGDMEADDVEGNDCENDENESTGSTEALVHNAATGAGVMAADDDNDDDNGQVKVSRKGESTHSHAQPFCGPLSRTTGVSRCRKKSSSGLLWCKGE